MPSSVPTTSEAVFKDILEVLAQNTQLRDGLKVFVDQWGVDSYKPSEDVSEPVRFIIAAVIAASEKSAKPDLPPEPTDTAETWRFNSV